MVFQCRDEGPLRVEVKWSRGNGAEGLPFPPRTRDYDGRLEIPNVKVLYNKFRTNPQTSD